MRRRGFAAVVACRLAAELDKLGHKISHTVVGELLKEQKFSLQANSKTREGADNPDRDAQFHVINDAVKTAMAENQPAISVDTKKKELVGDFKNAGRAWRKQGDPEEVRVHDFLIKELGRAVPYGVYDLAANTGWVNVGIDNDTAAFAVHTIRRWWQEVGHVRYPLARRLIITADGGGSSGSRVRLWKLELQRLADELGISIEVHHLPPGTSKWNEIEHRLFSFITQNWRAKPRVSYPGHCRTDRRHHHQNWLDGSMRTRQQNLSQGNRRIGRGNAKPQHPARNRSIQNTRQSDCFLTSPKIGRSFAGFFDRKAASLYVVKGERYRESPGMSPHGGASDPLGVFQLD